MGSIVINKVFLEDDLSVFKIITGNRSVDAARVKKIKASINNIGMIDAPIVCNENMEVIDGQGRLQACRELGKPVPYIIIEGLTIDHCRAMNLNQTNWQLNDYIKSYADEGNINYIRLREYIKASGLKGNIALDVVYHADSGNHDAELREGKLTFSEVDQSLATTIALWLHQFDGIETNRPREFCRALVFCYDTKSVDNDVLFKKIQASPRAFLNITKTYDCLGVIEDVYNKRIRNDHVWIQHEYEVWMEQRGIAAAAAARRRYRQKNKQLATRIAAS